MGILGRVVGWASSLFNQHDELTFGDLKWLTRRNKFSKYLPSMAYDPPTRQFINNDDTIGFMWECKPLYFAGGDTITKLEGLFRLKYPLGSVMQFIMYGDHDISHLLDLHRKTVNRTDNPLLTEGTEEFVKFLEEAADGLDAMKGIPIRNFRLFITIKFPRARKEEGLTPDDIFNAVHESLRSAQLHPEPMDASDYLTWMRKFFNYNIPANTYVGDSGKPEPLAGYWQEEIPLSKQIINAESGIRREKKTLHVGDRVMKCMTPRNMPGKVSPVQTNQIFGEIDGMASDTNQITSPFLYCLNVIFDDLNMKLHAKANFQLTQSTIASLSTSLQAKKQEIAWATKELEDKVPFLRVMPIMWIWENKDSKRNIGQSFARAWRVMEAQRYIMQEETLLLLPLFISALPFGLYNVKDNVDELERDFIAPASSITPILPVQGDFTGGGAPVLSYIGRKGQFIGLDIYGKGASNHNALVCATSGKGKSYNMNAVLKAYYGNGCKIRVVDIGGSYEKATMVYGAKYVNFTPKSEICLNPFTNIGQGADLSEEDKAEVFQTEMANIAILIMQMAFSATGKVPEDKAETASTLSRDAVSWAWSEKGNNARIDDVVEYLATFPRHADEGNDQIASGVDRWSEDSTRERASIARSLAFNLKEFTSSGSFGKWFNGTANLDISRDDFVVLELGQLLNQPALFGIITTQVINMVTQEIYLSERGTRRFLVFDEAHMFLKRDDAKTEHLAKAINNAYRMFRKFGASAWIVTQALTDLQEFGPVGRVILNNSAFKFYLESSDFSRALQEKLIDYDSFVMYLLNTVRTNVPHYSEIFMDTPFGLGIGRLCTDRYNYYINTSSSDDIKLINTVMEQEGLNYAEAIRKIVAKESGLS